MKIVQIINDAVWEIMPVETLEELAAVFPTEITERCVEAPDEVEQNWVYDSENGIFSEPTEILEPPDSEPSPDGDVYSELAAAIREGVNEI